MRRMPTVFEKNLGQSRPEYRYLVRDTAMRIGLRSDGFDVAMSGTGGKPGLVRFRFLEQSQASKLIAEGGLSGKANYLRGSDKTQWLTGVPMYERVRYESMYPGIDVVFYGNGEELEHDFIVSPGADAKDISLELGGDFQSRIDAAGDLILGDGNNSLVIKKPFAYQEAEQRRIPVEAEYTLKGGRLGFRIGQYDPSLPLVIDPVFVYSTFVAGSRTDTSTAVAVDSNGNVYVTGVTHSTDFPILSAYDSTCGSCDSEINPDVYVTKLDSAGAIVYSTYIGGNRSETPWAIQVDADGKAIVGGNTNSSDFPTLNSLSSYEEFNYTFAFVLSLAPNGAALSYSSLIGRVISDSSNQQDSVLGGITALALTVDSAGAAYITGKTADPAFPITPGTLSSTVPDYPNWSMFVTKLRNSGAVAYSTVVPPIPSSSPSFRDFRPYALQVDASGNVFIGGRAHAGLPTTTGVLSSSFPGNPDSSELVGFILKLNPTASAIEYATYIPGTAWVRAIALKESGEAYIAGVANSPTFAVTQGAFQTTMSQTNDLCKCTGFVALLDPTATSLSKATFLSGTPIPQGAGTDISSMALDDFGNVFVGGITRSSDFPTKWPLQGNFPFASVAGFVTQFKPDLSDVLFSSFLNGLTGLYKTHRLHVAAAAGNHLVVAGSSDAWDYPTTEDSFQPTVPATAQAGSIHPFVTKIDMTRPSGTACLPPGQQLGFGPTLINTTSPPSDLVITNCGEADLRLLDILISAPEYAETNDCTTAIPPGGSCTVAVTFSPTESISERSMVIVTDAPVSRLRIALVGTAVAPFLSAPPSRNFGEQVVGTSGSPVVIGVSNTGLGDLLISDVQITGDFSFEHTCSAPILYRTGCGIRVTFLPVATGTRTGQLTIYSNAPEGPRHVQLTGTGVSVPDAQPSVTTLTISPDRIAQSPITLTATVESENGMPIGTVMFAADGSTLATSNLIEGTAIATVTLPAGSHEIAAYYSGHADFLPSSKSMVVDISKVITVTTISAPNDALLGTTVVVTATVNTSAAPAVGTVTFKARDQVLGNVDLSQSGQASLQTNSLAAGSHRIIALYAGASDFLASTSAEVTLNVVNPVPAIHALSPVSVRQNSGGFTLALNGSGFVNGAVVRWNDSPRTTTVASPSQLTASVSATDLATAGTARITVINPGPGGGASGSALFAVDTATQASISIASAGVTIGAGQTASIPMQLAGFSGAAAVSCLNAPAGVTCSYSAASNSLTVQSSPTTPKGTYVLTIVVSTNMTSQSSVAGSTWIVGMWTFSLPVGLILLEVCRSGVRRHLLILGVASVFVIASACGGGGSPGTPGTPNTPTPQPAQASASLTLIVQ
ncbi:MAG: Ig-like domain repeat protein [Candidatus Korobacteraceae bacterium]